MRTFNLDRLTIREIARRLVKISTLQMHPGHNRPPGPVCDTYRDSRAPTFRPERLAPCIISRKEEKYQCKMRRDRACTHSRSDKFHSGKIRSRFICATDDDDDNTERNRGYIGGPCFFAATDRDSGLNSARARARRIWNARDKRAILRRN